MKDSDLRLKKEKIVLDLFEKNYKIYIFLIIFIISTIKNNFNYKF